MFCLHAIGPAAAWGIPDCASGRDEPAADGVRQPGGAGARAAAWPGVAVELRADSGFATPRLYAWCEAQGVDYTIGLIPNAVLEAAAAPLPAAAQVQSQAQDGAKVRPGQPLWQALAGLPTLPVNYPGYASAAKFRYRRSGQ